MAKEEKSTLELPEKKAADSRMDRGKNVLETAATRKAAISAGVEKPAAGQAITPEERWNMIAVAAYYRAEQRGFVGGSPADDWITAEKEINELLNGGNVGGTTTNGGKNNK